MQPLDPYRFKSWISLCADYCDIPELMTHLQNNYRCWKELEEKPKDAQHNPAQASHMEDDSAAS